MEPLAIVALLGAFALIVRFVLRHSAAPATAPPAAPAPAATDPDATGIYALAKPLYPSFQNSAHPRDLLALPAFVRGVEFLSSQEVAEQQLLEYARGDNQLIACMALEALGRRSTPREVLRGLRNFEQLAAWAFWFALRATLARPSEEPLLGAVLVRLGAEFEHEYNRF